MKQHWETIALALAYLVAAAIPIGLILASPVMREPTGTISATAYFGDKQ